MTCEVDQTGFGGFGNEFFVDGGSFVGIGFFGQEGDVHQGAAALVDGGMIVVAVVEVIVEEFGFFGIAFEHAFGTAVGFDPVEDEAHDIDGIAGRRIEHRAILGMSVIAQHGGNGAGEVFADEGLADDDEGDASIGEGFLGTGIEQAAFGDIERFTEDARGNVGNERCVARIGDIAPFGAENRVVHRDMNIVIIALDFVNFGNVAATAIARRGHDIDLIHKALGFIDGFLGPDTRVDIGNFAALFQVERNHGKLEACTALQEQDFVIVGNVHEFADFGFNTFDDGFVGVRTVAHFHDGLAGAIAVEHLFGADFEHGCG